MLSTERYQQHITYSSDRKNKLFLKGEKPIILAYYYVRQNGCFKADRKEPVLSFCSKNICFWHMNLILKVALIYPWIKFVLMIVFFLSSLRKCMILCKEWYQLCLIQSNWKPVHSSCILSNINQAFTTIGYFYFLYVSYLISLYHNIIFIMRKDCRSTDGPKVFFFSS